MSNKRIKKSVFQLMSRTFVTYCSNQQHWQEPIEFPSLCFIVDNVPTYSEPFAIYLDQVPFQVTFYIYDLRSSIRKQRNRINLVQDQIVRLRRIKSLQTSSSAPQSLFYREVSGFRNWGYIENVKRRRLL